MLKKIIFLILLFTFSNVYAQNTNKPVSTPKPVATNAVAVPTPKKTPRPAPTPKPVAVDRVTGYGDAKVEEPPANSTVRGRVFYEDSGRPVKRTSIMLFPKARGGGRDYGAITDGNGYFQIKNVREGVYFAIVNAPGVVSPLALADVSKQRDEDSFMEAFSHFDSINVNGINDIDVQVGAKRGGAISGRIMYADGDVAIGVSVQILRKVDGKFIPVIPNFSVLASAMMQSGGTFKTDDRGFYRFAGLPTGDYIVKVVEQVSHSGDSDSRGDRIFEEALFGRSSSLMTMFYPDVFESEKAEIINLQLGQEVSEINVTIPNRDVHNISGKIVAEKDKLPIVNAKVTLKIVNDNTAGLFDFDERNKPNTVTDDEGKFTFKEVPSGKYKVIVEARNSVFNQKKQVYGIAEVSEEDYKSAPAYATNSANREILAKTMAIAQKQPKFSKKSQEIVLTDKGFEDLTIELGFGATISGTVLYEKNESVSNTLTIFAFNEDDESLSSARVYSYNGNNTNNSFDLESLPEGKVKFTFSNNDYWVKSATLRGTDLTSNAFEIKNSEIIKGMQVVLSNDFGILKGKVLDEEGEPAKNQLILLVPTDSGKRKSDSFNKSVMTNQNGEFEVKLPPFEYAVISDSKSVNSLTNKTEVDKWFDEQVKNSQKITIEINKTQTISVKMKK